MKDDDYGYCLMNLVKRYSSDVITSIDFSSSSDECQTPSVFFPNCSGVGEETS